MQSSQKDPHGLLVFFEALHLMYRNEQTLFAKSIFEFLWTVLVFLVLKNMMNNALAACGWHINCLF